MSSSAKPTISDVVSRNSDPVTKPLRDLRYNMFSRDSVDVRFIAHSSNASQLSRPHVNAILRIHVTSPILGERISAIILPQRKQWLSVELNRWRSETIHCYFLNNKNRTLIIIM